MTWNFTFIGTSHLELHETKCCIILHVWAKAKCKPNWIQLKWTRETVTTALRWLVSFLSFHWLTDTWLSPGWGGNHFLGSVSMYLQMIPSITSSAPAPIDINRESLWENTVLMQTKIPATCDFLFGFFIYSSSFLSLKPRFSCIIYPITRCQDSLK